jgi:hypothetical protein
MVQVRIVCEHSHQNAAANSEQGKASAKIHPCNQEDLTAKIPAGDVDVKGSSSKHEPGHEQVSSQRVYPDKVARSLGINSREV